MYNNCRIITECIGDDDDDIHVVIITGNDDTVKHTGQSTGPITRTSWRGRKAQRNVENIYYIYSVYCIAESTSDDDDVLAPIATHTNQKGRKAQRNKYSAFNVQ